jgi:hypothetical protein
LPGFTGSSGKAWTGRWGGGCNKIYLGLLIRCEGSIPKSPLARGSLGAEPRVWTPSQIPYKNNIPRPLAAGLLIPKTREALFSVKLISLSREGLEVFTLWRTLRLRNSFFSVSLLRRGFGLKNGSGE